ncbi:hypothetical protein THOM_3124 [Trachipleistophora hominis]|uniref:Uncharacterized protein n=1 Tax=Trachipleistophora hominis TaxID=72359 RepID=L7JRC1_TRAHO|nr:hypothetical protein THOM_3124 [Trachipleistophora hominis]
MYLSLYLFHFVVFASAAEDTSHAMTLCCLESGKFCESVSTDQYTSHSIRERVNEEIKPKLKAVKEKCENIYKVVSTCEVEHFRVNTSLILSLYGIITDVMARSWEDEAKLVIHFVYYVQEILLNAKYDTFNLYQPTDYQFSQTYYDLYLRTGNNFRHVINKYCLTNLQDDQNWHIINASVDFMENICDYLLTIHCDVQSAMRFSIKFFTLNFVNQGLVFLNKIISVFVDGYQTSYMTEACLCGVRIITSRLYVASSNEHTLCTLCLMEKWMGPQENLTGCASENIIKKFEAFCTHKSSNKKNEDN